MAKKKRTKKKDTVADDPRLAELLSKGGTDIDVYQFYAFVPDHTYIYKPTGDKWLASGVNARLRPVLLFDGKDKPLFENEPDKKTGEPIQKTMRASLWLDLNRPVEQMTWAPGEPPLIKDRLMADGGWFEQTGSSCFNLYREPRTKYVDPVDATPWIDLVRRLYPDDADQLIAWFAQRVQDPKVKINHALVLGGAQGIGKDTLLEPVKYAVGSWNWKEISPSNLFETWTDFTKAVILRISEARDLGDINRYQFYEGTKTYAAAPPDVLRCNEKFVGHYYLPNVLGMIITTNYKATGLYLPPDDRRHYVAWSALKPPPDPETPEGKVTKEYFDRIWKWYREEGGLDQVADYLWNHDISKFNPKAPPKKTEAFWAIVDANRAAEDDDLPGLIGRLGNPDAITIDDLTLSDEVKNGFNDLLAWLTDRKHTRHIPDRLEKAGYARINNPNSKEGRWKVGDKQSNIYVKETFTVPERLKAAEARVAKGAAPLKKVAESAPPADKPVVADFEAARQKRGNSTS
jgi:hypothetical protein